VVQAKLGFTVRDAYSYLSIIVEPS